MLTSGNCRLRGGSLSQPLTFGKRLVIFLDWSYLFTLFAYLIFSHQVLAGTKRLLKFGPSEASEPALLKEPAEEDLSQHDLQSGKMPAGSPHLKLR